MKHRLDLKIQVIFIQFENGNSINLVKYSFKIENKEKMRSLLSYYDDIKLLNNKMLKFNGQYYH
ncbi:hypothetical protein BpHYR1_044000 [Brachionus plicatilis]|uniref:Uncharacterized protein n=1 Tax=Brachionus plicatilis TaxID=10195 RepID=A0A3M7P3L6_BRAPC|nr:hypothetical protein BpHYR1_044000 [Brachionus plicatilis]